MNDEIQILIRIIDTHPQDTVSARAKGRIIEGGILEDLDIDIAFLVNSFLLIVFTMPYFWVSYAVVDL